MKEKIINYINENLKIIIVISSIIIMAIFIGIFLFQFIPTNISNELVQSMKNTLELTKSENFTGINIIKNGMISNIILVLIIYSLSFTLFSPYLISLLSFFKGLAVGLYIPTFFSIFGMTKGIIATLILVLIPNLVYIPSYIFFSVNAIKFHYYLLSGENKLKNIITEMIKIIFGFSIMFLGVILEQLMSSWIISLYGTI